MTIAAPSELAQSVQQRRNFAIISHPDAGKTTMAENYVNRVNPLNLRLFTKFVKKSESSFINDTFIQVVVSRSDEGSFSALQPAFLIE